MPALFTASVLDKEHLFDHWRGPLIGLVVGGFIIAVVGHIVQFKSLIVTGIAMVFLAVLILPIFLYVQGAP